MVVRRLILDLTATLTSLCARPSPNNCAALPRHRTSQIPRIPSSERSQSSSTKGAEHLVLSIHQLRAVLPPRRRGFLARQGPPQQRLRSKIKHKATCGKNEKNSWILSKARYWNTNKLYIFANDIFAHSAQGCL